MTDETSENSDTTGKVDDTQSGSDLDTPIPQKNNPLHGITLKVILTTLIDEVGWEEMAYRTGIRMFTDRPTQPSSLKFLRTTPWARLKVENLYLRHIKK